jgi:hypothetical protein
MKNADADRNSTRSASSNRPSPSAARVDGCIEGIREIEDEAALLGHVYFLGVLHHAWFVRVEDRDGEQVAFNDPYNRLDDFHRLDADQGPLQTVEVPGFDGEYVLVVYPGGN